MKIKKHPFPFLLYLEWALLSFAIFISLIPVPTHEHIHQTQQTPQLAILSLIAFGIMGLKLPQKNKLNKILYTLGEIVLILLIGFTGGKIARLFPFLYLILVTRSCLIFSLSGRLIVTILAFLLFLLTLSQRLNHIPQTPTEQERFWFFTFNLVVLFGLALMFVLLLMNGVLAERQSREKLALAHEKLRQYALKIENQATLEERNRIAREIHDSLGHTLTALNLQLETALKLYSSNPTKAQGFLATAKELGSRALQDVRQSVYTMRLNPLQNQSLEEALNVIAENFQHSTGIRPILQIDLLYPVSTEINTAIYRIMQESLTNVAKYAQATEVKLELTQTTTNLNLSIKDNGKGFDLEQNTTGFGLQSMRDRTLALGGNFNIHSVIGAGCQITIDIPLSR